MSKYWSDRVKNTTPYKCGEQPMDRRYIKLNTNENPFPPSPKVLERMKDAIDGALRLYPDPSVIDLKSEIAKFHDVDRDQIFAGNGSDEVLALSFLAFINAGDRVVFPDITYSFYKVYAEFFNTDFETIPLNDDFTIPVEKFEGINANILLANPNAPTGIAVGLSQIQRMASSNADKIVLVDEAYVDFGGVSAVSLLKDNPNMIICQTFSKSRSLAGIRVGYAVASPELIEGLERVKNSFNSYTIDRVALAGAIEAIRDTDYFYEACNNIIRIRNDVSASMKKMGFHVLESSANFLFARHKNRSGMEIYEALRENGILVRHFNLLRIDDFVRITIGTEEEMNILAEQLSKIAE